ncbi:MAG: GntR family transcriptional regulator [Bacteroidota bacterium]|nr:GntR family transcriptional regulator [Bacteroidota bacterium]
MKNNNIFQYLSIDYFSATPKYIQLANSISKAIGEGKIEKDEVLPSINEISCEFEISRDTAEKGYKYLKKIGTLGSVPGKGYFVKNTEVKQQLKIFLLFNKLSVHKKIMYDAFVASIGEAASIDFYIYNNDFDFFKRLILNKKNDYSHYVIIPHFLQGSENAFEVINMIPKDKLILLDKLVAGVDGEYGAVYENFEKDIYNALVQATEQLSKYQTIKIIFPNYTYHPKEILEGFIRYCQEYAFNYKVVQNLQKEPVKEGDVYINLMENDMVFLIEKILTTKMKVGKDIGIISYNETPWKKFILNGITTVSTDFKKMGEMAAQMVLTNDKRYVEVPFVLTLRNSL